MIGLNLCPFARAPYQAGRVHFEVSAATSPDELLEDLMIQLQALVALPEQTRETTLLIHPGTLLDFGDFNDFLAVADEVLAALELEGVVQIASFHPQYRFAGTEPEDVENCSNRSPYPILHLLRENSVAWAVERMTDPDEIYRNNIRRLRGLGRAGWQALWSDRQASAEPGAKD